MPGCRFRGRHVTLTQRDRSRCGAVHILRTRSEPSAHFGCDKSLSLWRGAHFEHAKRTLCACCSEVSDQQCCSEVSFRSVNEQCGSGVGQKCGSEVFLISVNQKCGSAVLLKLSIRSVNQKCGAKVLLKSVDQKCCLEKSVRKNVAQKCWSKVSIRKSVVQKC